MPDAKGLPAVPLAQLFLLHTQACVWHAVWIAVLLCEKLQMKSHLQQAQSVKIRRAHSTLGKNSPLV